MNLKALFRQVSMVVPDSSFITEILLYSSGFMGAQSLAKKIVLVQSRANEFISHQKVQFDFGLRSIKAIVQAAAILKLQAQAITDCELSEIIDDETLRSVNYQTECIISEVMEDSQFKIADAVAEHQYKAQVNEKDSMGNTSMMMISSRREKSTVQVNRAED